MVRKALFLLLFFAFSGCFYTRSAAGNIRFKESRFSIKPNSNTDVYKLIDTTKLYEIISVKYLQTNTNLDIFRKRYLKFYANGRLGDFDIYYENSVTTLNPQNAKMAFYNYNGKDVTIQFYFEGKQGSGLITRKIKFVDDKKLELIGENFLEIYKVVDLPKRFLIYKPDW